MTTTIKTRLAKLEKETSAQRMGYSLEQLVLASLGHDVGPPSVALKPGEKPLAELIEAATRERSGP